MLETYEKNSKKKLVATVLTVLVVAGSVVFADHFKSERAEKTTVSVPTTSQTAPAVATTTAPTTTTSTTATASSSTSTGTFTASSNYYVPHGNESIQVSLTVRGGVITSASIQNSEGDRESASYQEDFAASYKTYVVGKKISGLQLSTIAGASDTTQGFNDALTQIASKVQA